MTALETPVGGLSPDWVGVFAIQHVLELGQCRGGSHLDGRLSYWAAEPERQCQARPCYSKEKCLHTKLLGAEKHKQCC